MKGGVRDVIIKKNGASDYAYARVFGTPTAEAISTVTALVDLAAGDYVELIVYQTSGVAVDVLPIQTYFAMAYIGE